MLLKSFLILLILGSYLVKLNAQSTVPQLFASGEYQTCIDACDETIHQDSMNAQAYFFKGASLVRLADWTSGEKCLLEALKKGFPKNPIFANLLRIYAHRKQEDQVKNYLDSMVLQGSGNYRFLENEIFNIYEEKAFFKEAKTAFLQNAFPCKANTASQKLDFWLGDWNVHNPTTNAIIATSTISKSEDGCTLYEDYEHVSGFFGRSINYFDPADSLYKQLWVDMRNNISRYEETDAGPGTLTMLANLGNGTLTRTTWTYDTLDLSVLQAAENSSDSGKTWSPGFIGIYRPKSHAIKESIQSILKEMESLFQDNAMAKIAEFYTEEAQIWEPGGKVYTGRNEIIQYWAALDGNGIKWDLELIDMDISGPLISTVLKSILIYRVKDQEQQAKTKAFVEWEKTPKGYKIKKDFFQLIK